MMTTSAVPRPPEALGQLADVSIGKPFEATCLLQAICDLLADRQAHTN